MKRICPKCHYIGHGKRMGSILLGGFLIGIGISAYGTPAQKFDNLPQIILTISLIGGLFGIINYFRFGRKCPNCDYKEMLLIDDPVAQEIIKKYGLAIEDTPTYICTECHNRVIRKKNHSLIFSIVLILFGLLLAFIHLMMNHPLGFLGSLIIFGTGIFGIASNIFTSNKCPACNSKSLKPFDPDQNTTTYQRT